MPQNLSAKQQSLLASDEHAPQRGPRHRSLHTKCAVVCAMLGTFALAAFFTQGESSDTALIVLLGLGAPRKLGFTTLSRGNTAKRQASNSKVARGIEPSSFPHAKGFLPYGRSSVRIPHATATVFEPADLTPAVDKYARLPPLNTSRELMLSDVAPKGKDPFKLAEKELQPLSEYVFELVKSENPVLKMAAGHFFNKRQGNRFRPTVVVLLAQAMKPEGQSEDVVERQQLLAQITDMMHVASLIHEDVLEEAEMTKGGLKALIRDDRVQNKVAVLGGDYLLARAASLLARLQHLQVVEVMAAALDSLVLGEIMQAQPQKDQELDMDYYLRKSYFKTASLICNACKSTAFLAGFAEQDNATIVAEKFGYHLGMAYQIVKDILEFKEQAASLSKKSQADIQMGLATAPMLFAADVNHEIKPLIKRRFSEQGDIQKALTMARETDCVDKSHELANFHAQTARDALLELDESESRDALLRLLHTVLAGEA